MVGGKYEDGHFPWMISLTAHITFLKLDDSILLTSVWIEKRSLIVILDLHFIASPNDQVVVLVNINGAVLPSSIFPSHSKIWASLNACATEGIEVPKYWSFSLQ